MVRLGMSINSFQLSQALKELFDTLNERNIPYCVWGGYRNLPAELTGSDIDIIVPKISETLASVLEMHGFVPTRARVVHGIPVVFVRYFPEEKLWVPLHIVTPVLPSGYRIAPSDFYQHFKWHGNIKIVQQELELLILLAHGLAKGKTTEKRIKRAESILCQQNFKKELFEQMCDKLFGRSNLYETCISVGFSGIFQDKKLLNELRSLLRAYGNRETGLRRYFQKTKRLFYSLGRRLQFLLCKRGQLIALTGIDGAGKSSFIKDVKVHPGLKSNLFVSFGMGTRFFPRILAQPIRRVQIWISQKPRYSKFWRLASAIASTLRLFFDYISLSYLYLRARLYALKGVNVIFDRYALDHLLKKSYVGERNSILIAMAEFLFIRCFPKPDLLVYFDISPHYALQRKDEDSFAILSQKYVAYQKIFEKFSVGKQFLRIDARATLGETKAGLFKMTWHDLVSR